MIRSRLRALTPRQRLMAILLVALSLIVLPPAGRWVWHTILHPPEEHPLLPYGELRVGIDTSYPPFGLDADGQLSGLDVDLARAVAAELGVPLRFVPLGYDGLYDALLADQADALFSALRFDPLRLGRVLYTISYFDAGQVLVAPPGAGITTLHDLDGRRLAVEFGTAGDQEARAWQRRLHTLDILPYEWAADALHAVQAGAADAALVDAVAARLWLREHDGLAIAPEYVTYDPYTVAVAGNNSRLWEAINEALTTLLQNGTADDIIARWL